MRKEHKAILKAAAGRVTELSGHPGYIGEKPGSQWSPPAPILSPGELQAKLNPTHPALVKSLFGWALDMIEQLDKDSSAIDIMDGTEKVLLGQAKAVQAAMPVCSVKAMTVYEIEALARQIILATAIEACFVEDISRILTPVIRRLEQR